MNKLVLAVLVHLDNCTFLFNITTFARCRVPYKLNMFCWTLWYKQQGSVKHLHDGTLPGGYVSSSV